MRREVCAAVNSRHGLRAAVGGSLVLAAALAWPARCPGAGPEKARALAGFFPRENLVAYAEFDGLDAHADLWRKTAAYRLLNETATGAMLEDLATQLFSRSLSGNTPQPQGADGVRAAVEHLARSGFAAGLVLAPDDPRPRCLGLVFRGAARGKVRESFEKLIVSVGAEGPPRRTVAKPGGRKLVVEGAAYGSALAWWAEGDDLAVCLSSPEGADFMIDALDGRRPDATGLPLRASLAVAGDGFTPVARAFLDVAALPPLPAPLAAYGLDRVKRVDYRWGFDGPALATRTRVVAPAPRTGILSVFEQRPFDRNGIARVPADVSGVTAFSLNLVEFYERITSGVAATDPETRDSFEAFETTFRNATGLRLRDDLLPRLGPGVTFYDVPTPIDAPMNGLVGLGQGLFRCPGFVAVIDVHDVKAFSGTLDDSMAKLREYFQSRAEKASRPPAVRVHKLDGPAAGYSLSVSPTAQPWPAGLRPTFVLGKGCLIFGNTPEAARVALALEGKAAAGGGPVSRSLRQLPARMIFAHVDDPRRTLLPELVANLPGLIQWGGTVPSRLPQLLGGQMQATPFSLNLDPDRVPSPDDLRPFLFPSVFTLTSDDDGFQFTTHEAFPAFNPVALAPFAAAMVLPAVQSIQTSRRRSQATNNLKQIGLALHNFHSVNDHFPPRAIVDADGKPLLSWRVAILPLIDQQALYNEFKLDEPWDSEHNKALIPRMPSVYTIPGLAAEEGKTFYRGFNGPHALFDPEVKAGVGMAQVTDGTSNTLGIVEARQSVIWTRPDEEIPFDPDAPADKLKDLVNALGGHTPGGFVALLLDGSVRVIKETVNPEVLKALVTRDGGEVIAQESF